MNNKVREYRIKVGMTQRELAIKVGLTRQTIGLIENDNYNPSLRVCLNIADTLEESLDALFNPKYF
ncbi:helix-turn-helix transcriptional regulator [Lentilactobacillus parafarraginis]|uniref:Helix-turn-helix transcriptional regulator n=1 Tax=Lentilactobacillus parafarraginis TaxID=390842 RepID=A0A5R9CH15_9LACO|nr:helix-turn-helix transcriptional regulator [Lentilactobacillus parafarraginis]TLQ14592.1 helix-turn-helix transcriptional regulator [Lentilactobacillus parafarraginis]